MQFISLTTKLERKHDGKNDDLLSIFRFGLLYMINCTMTNDKMTKKKLMNELMNCQFVGVVLAVLI